MKGLLKLILGLAGLLIIVIVAAVITIATLDPNQHKEWIISKVEDETGRSLAIDGDIGITLYPWLGVEINDLTLGNARGFGNEPFVHFSFFKARIKTLPLLQQQYEIDTVQLRGADINLARNKAGVSNWDDLMRGGQGSGEPLPLTAVVLGGLDIDNATLSWRDETSGADYRFSNIRAKTGELTYGAPVELSLTMDMQSAKPELAGPLSLNATVHYDLDSEQYRVEPLVFTSTLRGRNIPGGETNVELQTTINMDGSENSATVAGLQFQALGTRIAGDLRASRIDTVTPSIQASLDVDGEDLALLFKVAEIEPFATDLSRIRNRHFKLTTLLDVDLQRGDVSLSQFDAKVLGAAVSGSAKGRNVKSDVPSFSGNLSAAGPDLPALLRLLGQLQGGTKSPLSRYGRKLKKLSGKAFTVAAKFDADLKTGDISVPALTVKTLGIDISGNLTAHNMQSDKGTVQGKLEMSGSKLRPLLKAVDQAGAGDILDALDLIVGIAGTRTELRLQPFAVDAVLVGDQFRNGKAEARFTADARANLNKQRLVLNNLRAQGLNLNLGGRLRVDNFAGKPEIKGRLKLEPFNLRAFMRALKQKPPRTTDKKVLRKVALQSDFAGSATQFSLENLALTMDQTQVTGEFSLKNFNKPKVRFDVNVDGFNMDRYLPPQSKGKQPPVTPETAAGAATQLPVKLLRAVDIKGDFRVGHLVVSKARLNAVRLHVVGKNGKIKLDPGTAKLYQGTYSGNIILDATGKLPRLTINSALKGVQAEPLLRDVTGEAKIRGVGNFSAALVAVGADSRQLKNTLTGQMSFSFHDGAIKGFNLGKIMRQGKSLKDTFSLSVSEREETDFSVISGNPVANNGIVRLNDLDGKAPGLRLSGKGVLADLRRNTLDYKVTAMLVATSTGQGGKELQAGKLEGVPLDCTFKGSLDAPKRKCDASKLLAALGMKLLESVIGIPGKVVPGGDGGASGNTGTPVDPAQELLDKALKSIFD